MYSGTRNHTLLLFDLASSITAVEAALRIDKMEGSG